MIRYRFLCEYLGSAFHGWQVQHGSASAYTVQAELEHAFFIVLKTKVSLICAGRTDAGVHARGQCVHFDWDGVPLDCLQLERSINGIAHRAVCIRNLEVAPSNFHARYGAISRYYRYTIYTRPVALAREYGWQCGKLHLDVNAMEREARYFLGTHDFIAFCIPRNDGKSTLCTLTEFRLEREEHVLLWHIKGNRFLHRQVRSMVGILVDVGRGKHPEASVESILAGKFHGQRMWAPPEGLCLEKVEYPTEQTFTNDSAKLPIT
ncbi:MAG TPA: tRNA pseudouridine(38-40) synthase TruA [Fibrobacteraceae bacterium]|nr:tRNA pseudouridine(38-40) synthase TruA [Fibrobacteraceae bacterium]